MIKNITNLINYNDAYSLTMDCYARTHYKMMKDSDSNKDNETHELVNTILKTKYNNKNYGRSTEHKSISKYC